MTESLVDKLRRLDKEATPGPWEAFAHSPSTPHDQQGWSVWRTALGGQQSLATFTPPNADRDAAFLVAMRNALPELLRLVEAAQRATTLTEMQTSVRGRELREALRPLVERPPESQT